MNGQVNEWVNDSKLPVEGKGNAGKIKSCDMCKTAVPTVRCYRSIKKVMLINYYSHKASCCRSSLGGAGMNSKAHMPAVGDSDGTVEERCFFREKLMAFGP